MSEKTFPYAKFHVRAPDNPKVAALSDRDYRAWTEMFLYCADNLTDGFIPERVAKERWHRSLKGLLAGAVLHVVKGGYLVHDYLHWNDSKAEVHARQSEYRRAGEARASSAARDDAGRFAPTDAPADAGDAGPAKDPPGIQPTKTKTNTTLYTNTKTSTNGSKALAAAARPRAREPLFDALCLACGMNPVEVVGSEAKAIGACMATIRKHESFTVENIAERGGDENWTRVMGSATKTPCAICRHWARLAGSGRGSDRGPNQSQRLLGLAKQLERQGR